MWSDLPFDLLAIIFSFLPPDSLARARSACRNWHTCAKYTATSPETRHHPPWFIAFPTNNRGLSCFAHNPIDHNWHILSLDFIQNPIRPVAPISGGLILLRVTSSSTTALRLAICNPFTNQFRFLPMLNVPRTNPAVGVIQLNPTQNVSFLNSFRVYVAGGMSEAPSGGASYEPTIETYDSQRNTWKIIASIPVELAVRLTVWTPNESVYSNGVLYWMTSARAYSVMGFDISTNGWRELSVPMADKLEFAALVPRNGKLTLVGGKCGRDAWIWELGESEIWGVIEKMPLELVMRFLGGKGSWGRTKCVGIDEEVWLFKEIGSGMVVWRENVGKNKWEWIWVEGCSSIRGKKVENFTIKGVLIHPNLAPSCFLDI